MKKAKKKIALALLCCVVTAFAATGIAFSSSFSKITASASNETYADSKLDDRYVVGDTVKVPATYFDEEKTIEATAYVTYPNGVYERTDKISCSVAGKYIVEYKAEKDGTSYYSDQEFTVYEPLYQTDKKTNVVKYEEARNFAKIKYVEDENGNTDGTATVESETAVSGLYVPLTAGTTFTYNKVFDISKKTKNDVIFSANIVATEDGYADFLQLTVRFTDVYDSSNYVDVVLWHNYTSTPGSDKKEGEDAHEYDVRKDRDNYLRAGASNQPVSGNDNGRIWSNGRYGMRTKISMMNCPALLDRATDTFDIRFDYTEKAVYGPNRGTNASQAIIDLDNPEHFTDLWEGFTTGECTVSVFASDFQKASGAVFIQSIFDDSGSDFADNYLLDTAAPNLEIDFEGADEDNLPFGVVGTAYPIFGATATDLSGYVGAISTDVYYNYHTTTPIKISVKDGAFTPAYKGRYTIVYSVCDAFGNKAEKAVDVDCVADDSSFKVTLANDDETTISTGHTKIVSAATVSGYSGKYDLTVTAVIGDDEYAIDGETLSFVPLKSGNYTIKYSAKDFLNRTATAEYYLTVENSNSPVFLSDVSLPKYFIVGYSQTLPSLTAVDFSDSDKVITAKVYVKDGDTKTELGEGLSYEPSEKTSDYTVTVIYEATGKNGTSEKTYDVRCHHIKSGSGVDKKELFVMGEGVGSSYESVGSTTEYATYSTELAASIEYVNQIPAHGFNISLNVLKSGFGKLSLTLTDAVYGNSIKASFERNNDTQIYFSVNDGLKYTVDNYSFDDPASLLTLHFDNLLRRISTDNANVGFSVTKDTDGNAFKGFLSGKVYLKIDFEDVSGEAKILVREVYGQTLISSKRDGLPPLLVINGEYRANVSYNKPLTIFSAVCLDMIDPDAKATLTVTSPSGNYVTANDGTLLNGVSVSKEYVITPNEYGEYKLIYKIEGASDVTESFNVVDEEAPVITVSSTVKSQYKVGDTVTLSATATDNVSTNVNVYACVNNALGVTEYVSGGSYKFLSAGKYKVTFYAMDERGNYAFVAYTITVKE